MSVLEKLKKAIYQIDMFCSSQMLRYNSETQYKTLTGGLFSLSIIIFIAVGFASMISDTLNRTTITSTVQTIKQSDPPLSILKPSKEGMFMFGVSVQSTDVSLNLDLSQEKRFFDLAVVIGKVQSGAVTERTLIPVQRCTVDHWSMLPGIADRFDALAASTWLCPPLDYQMPIQGTFASSLSYLVAVQIGPCVNSSMFDRVCAPQDEIDSLMTTYQNFYLSVNYINPVFSPTQPDHISYYLETGDYVIFSNIIGADAWIYFTDYTINTDNSIWPIQDDIVETGCIVEQKAINHPFSVVAGSAYGAVYLAKSINSIFYTRTVQKVSAILSYIGGLVGAMTAVLFLIKIYTDSSLEITIGINLFNDFQKKDKAEDRVEEQPSFNLFKFIALSIFQILKSLGIRKKWPSISKLEVFQKEIIYQLDIKMLLKRIIYLQVWMTYLFDEEQLVGLKYQKPISCERAKKMRELVLHQKGNDQEEKELDAQIGQQTSKFEATDKLVQMQSPQIFVEEIKKQNRSPFQINFTASDYRFVTKKCKKICQQLQIKEKEQTIPVQFVLNSSKISNKKQNKQLQSQASSTINKDLDNKSLKFLKGLQKRASQDSKSGHIWMNMREDIQKIVAADSQN